ncbi:MAG: LysE family translocator [Tepidamorphaceae bacterium]|nr:LysE family translocator [Rhodobiaceae bacterium]MCC0049515.1 LysE family translocator [Rhodobiaceae bacterium]
MSIEHLIAFNITLIAAILSPGPAFLVAVQTTLRAGRRAGIATGCGLALMASVWTSAALLGLDAVFALFPWAYAAAKACGAVYLLYIAWNMWKGARDGIEPVETPARNAFLRGFLVNALNPKSMLFAAAVLIVIFPSDMSYGEDAVVVLNHLCVELIFYSALAFGMSTSRVSRGYLKAKVYLDRVASVILGGLGLRLLFSR